MDPIVLAALISLIATESAGLIAAIGLMITRKSFNGSSGARPTEFWEVRFREIGDGVRDNRDELRELKWILVARNKTFDELETALSNQGKALGEIANAMQRLLGRRMPR